MEERIGMCDTLDKLSLERKTEESSGKWASSNKVLVARDVEGHKFVVIPQVIFKGKRSISWKEVEKYLIRYIGYIFQVLETEDLISVDRMFVNEYTGSNYTNKLRGASCIIQI